MKKILYFLLFVLSLCITDGRYVAMAEDASESVPERKTLFDYRFHKSPQEVQRMSYSFFRGLFFKNHDATPEHCFSSPFVQELAIAIENEDFDEIYACKDTGIINNRGANNVTPLFFAIGINESCFRCLLRNGADPNIPIYDSDMEPVSLLRVAFQFAVLTGETKYFKILLESGAKPAFREVEDDPKKIQQRLTVKSYPWYCPFDKRWYQKPVVYKYDLINWALMCDADFSLEVLQIMIEYGVDLNPRSVNYLFKVRNYKQLLFLLKNGADEKRICIDSQCATGPFVESFTQLHRTMQGFSKTEYMQWHEEKIDQQISFYRSLEQRGELTHFPALWLESSESNKKKGLADALEHWDDYWKVVDYFREKGYTLMSESESEKAQPYTQGKVIYSCRNRNNRWRPAIARDMMGISYTPLQDE